MDDKYTVENFKGLTSEILEFQSKELYPIKSISDQTRLNLVFLNHNRNYSSFLNICHCVDTENVEDIFTLSRAMYESVINMALLSKSLIENDIDRYLNHHYIDVFKTYTHLKNIGLEKLSGMQEEEFSYIKLNRDKYLKLFNGKNDNWSGQSMEARVKLVDKSFPPSCKENKFYEYLYCQVYRKGSRLTHGSYGGLSNSVTVESFKLSEKLTANRFKVNEAQLIFASFHSIIVFVSSMRFMGSLLDLDNIENYYHKVLKFIIS